MYAQKYPKDKIEKAGCNLVFKFNQKMRTCKKEELNNLISTTDD